MIWHTFEHWKHDSTGEPLYIDATVHVGVDGRTLWIRRERHDGSRSERSLEFPTSAAAERGRRAQVRSLVAKHFLEDDPFVAPAPESEESASARRRLAFDASCTPLIERWRRQGRKVDVAFMRQPRPAESAAQQLEACLADIKKHLGITLTGAYTGAETRGVWPIPASRRLEFYESPGRLLDLAARHALGELADHDGVFPDRPQRVTYSHTHRSMM